MAYKRKPLFELNCCDMNPAVFEKFAKAKITIQNYAQHGRLLLAVSGGIDSVVLAHLVAATGVKAGIAHVNYGLRRAESDGDAQFVAELAAKLGWELHLHTVTTADWATHKGSTQLKARKIRYGFFKRILEKEYHYRYVLLGHTLSDQVETMLFNLIRGTGVKGMRGVLAKRSALLRPLLHISRAEIAEYAEWYGLKWREDSSNAQLKYSRNIIRNELLPILKKINPGLEQTFELNQFRFQTAYAALYMMCNQLFDWVDHGLTCHKIDMLKVARLSRYQYGLYNYLSSFKISTRIIRQILEEPLPEKAKVFETADHVILLSGKKLHLFTKQQYADVMAPLTPTKFSKFDLMHFVRLKDFFVVGRLLDAIPENLKLPSYEAYIDDQKLRYPITIRSRMDGDVMKPLGMKGSKSISDLLTDKKIDHELRERLPVFVNADGQIIWMPGVAFSDIFKVSTNTRTVLHLRFDFDV